MAQVFSRRAGRVCGKAIEDLECRRLFAAGLAPIAYAGPIFPGSDPSHVTQLPHQVVGATFAELTSPLPVGATVYTDDLSTGQIIQPPAIAPYQTNVYLTGPSKQSPVDIVLGYLRTNAAALQLSAADAANPFVTDSYSDSDTGVTHVYMRQEFGGLPVTNADINATVMPDGRLESIAGGFVRDLDRSNININPSISAAQALVGMARSFGVTLTTSQISATQAAVSTDIYQTTTLTAPAFSNQPILAKLGFITTPGGVTLAWNLNVQTLDGKGWWDTYVDATTGRTLYGANWTNNLVGGGGTAGGDNRVESSAGPGLPSSLSLATSSQTTNTSSQTSDSPTDGGSSDGNTVTTDTVTDGIGNYTVYAQPLLSPDSGARTTVTTSGYPNASPYGWHDTNGATGAEFTTTVGNNVSAQDDTDGNNLGGTRPDGGSTLTFNNPIDLTQAPSTYLSAATTNLFYWNNLLHDIHYEYGFNEAAGNFQTNDYGKGGIGGDPVQADSQDGSALSPPSVNNANFSTPVDGLSGRMQMYLWNETTPNRDGDLDSRLIIDEYGYGVSNRVTGGPSNSSALSATQSAALASGWSDWWSLMLTQTPTDITNGENASFPIGTYVLGQPLTGAGLRRYPYSYSMTVDPETLGYYNISNQANNAGELWCTVLWDLDWNLIAKYGYSSNLSTGYVVGGPNNGTGAGNKLALQLVMDAEKLQPANPSFLDARNAIIQADQNLTGGQNIRTIWQTFARRGWGYSATTSGSSSNSVTEAYDVPSNLFDPYITSTSPSGTAVGNFNSITFYFSEPMNTSSFALGDIQSFTGPNSTNLFSQVTGFSWLTTQSLKVIFTTQTTQGGYSMTLGPDILAADNGDEMDQNQNGIPGEPGDNYTAAITYAPLTAKDSFGYQAGLTTMAVPNLVAGAAGVTSVLAGTDDSTVSVGLGSSTFSFYGLTYSSLFLSTNGLITFVSANSSSTPSNLSSSPSQAAIAPLWEDWVTNTSGNTTEKVLYRTDDTNNDGTPDRLIIQWNDVRAFNSNSNGATFSVALQLNTGTTPGTILFSFPDLDTGNSSSNGGAATTGIKDVGTQSTSAASRRLLINEASTSSPYVQQGNVVRISTDWNTPTLTSASYDLTSSVPTANYVFSRAVSGGSVSVYSQATGTNVPTGSISSSFYPATNTLSVAFPGFSGGVLPTGGYLITVSGYYDSALNVQSGDITRGLLVLNYTGLATAGISLSGGNTLLTTGGNTFSAASPTLFALDVRGTGTLSFTVDTTSGNPIPANNKLQVAATSLSVIGTAAADSVVVATSSTTIDGIALNGGAVSSIAFNGVGGSDSLTINKTVSFTATDGTALSIGNGATATVLADTALASLFIAPGGSTLDVNTYAVIVRSGALATLNALAAFGIGDGEEPSWTGIGITSSAAASDPTGTHGVGVIANDPSGVDGKDIYSIFHGFTVGDNDILIAYTVYGDADLSGRIDDNDYFLTNNGYALALTGWINGDFDYSGTIDDTDFYLQNIAFGLQKM